MTSVGAHYLDHQAIQNRLPSRGQEDRQQLARLRRDGGTSFSTWLVQGRAISRRSVCILFESCNTEQA